MIVLDEIIDSSLANKITTTNRQALKHIIQSHLVLIGYDQAIDVIPSITHNIILHARPLICRGRMCSAMKGAVTGALIFEGLVRDLDEATKLTASDGIIFSPRHEHDCVSLMAGVTSTSMFIHIVESKAYDNRAYTNVSEQTVRTLRVGADDQSVIDHLHWVHDALGLMLRGTMKLTGEIDLRLMLV